MHLAVALGMKAWEVPKVRMADARRTLRRDGDQRSMAKNSSSVDGHRNGAVRDRSHTSGEWKRDANTGQFVNKKSDSAAFKGVRREILFPTEPSTIGHKKIDRAVERVVSRKK